MASQWEFTGQQSADGSLPHLEANSGVLDGAMLHLLVPVALTASSGSSTAYRFGDVELGANVRLYEERSGRPQIGTFPIVTIPTGSSNRDLGVESGFNRFRLRVTAPGAPLSPSG